MRSDDAGKRLLTEGDLAWVNGPRRQEIARVVIDDALPRGAVVLRDIAGIAVSEIVRVRKPETDAPPARRPGAES
jgi:anaerobic selenocysteine-containing dehydrogenase